MPRRGRQPAAITSSELGDGDFAVSYNNKTGRPIRKSARKTESPFVDSAVALSEAEPDSSEYDDDVVSDDEGEGIISRKRVRSISPPLSEASLSSHEADLHGSEDDSAMLLPRPLGRPQHMAPLQLTLNVPAGPERQITLNIDLNSLMSVHHPLPSVEPPKKRRRGRPAKSNAVPISQPSMSKTGSQRAGFLDLPAELRNEIYRLVFVSPKRLDFGAPTQHFQRSAAFLRTCKTVHKEGRSILYAENEFFFQRQSRRHGNIYASDWSELGFKPVRKLLKSIGPINTGYIHHVTFLLEDAAPSLNPHLHNAEERRFVHDENLRSVLRHLGTHGRLEKFHINFQGRKTLDVYYPNDRFLEILTRIRADEVEFVKHPIWAQHSSYHSRSKQTSGVQKMCMEVMSRKKKLFAN